MDIVEKLRAEGENAMRKHLSLGMHALCSEAADEIERLRKEDEVNNDIIGMLRAQLRMHGHIPCIVESDEVGKAERKMRRAAQGH